MIDHTAAMIQEAHTASSSVGVVVIGRNEGERLRRCLQSLRLILDKTVYVDSGSVDSSVAIARSLGVTVHELDPDMPFTAARARNSGFCRLLEMHPTLQYVFFVDGDCEVIDGWVEKAGRFLDDHPRVAVVCGWRRERNREQSMYNMLCDLEWQDGPVGETSACGGDALIRVAAFRQAKGYRPDLICGEEPELCVRLRKAGWCVWRVNDDMTFHDAALFHFGQWWKRMMRGGYAFAQGAHLHGVLPERHCVSESRRVWIWGLVIPLTVLILAVAVDCRALALFVVYPIQVVRLALRGGGSRRENWLRAGALVLCKFPEVLGQLKFLSDRYRRVQSRLIEYK